MDIWASTNTEIKDFSLFDSHEHIYATIDAITHGDAPWKSFTTSYASEIRPNPPSWQLHDYQVWFRDPSMDAKNMLNNPDFNQQVDYMPYVELDTSGQRSSDVGVSLCMSGTDYLWRHSVRFFIDCYTEKYLNTLLNPRMTSSKTIQARKGKCIVQLFWAHWIRQLCW